MEQEYQVPPMVFPGMRQHEKAYAAAYDLLARRAPEEALGLLEPALEAEPENTGLRTLRAWAWMIRAQLGRAEAELRSLVEENPSDDWSRHALGRVLERQGKLEEALPHLRLAAVMSGDYDHRAAVFRVEQEIARRQDRG
ncbi:tetratricopeptide repeat protein [Nocardioides campestrisoli]|uniref:tetratricopeptide repeat protein n=1 Tax=Nocardioides campestrisoli TaxID=2736757 RepID=UPI001C63289E|nr:tetratricopeptide repeat protein [Nocardioides campestrisoli]